jgi:hypothetical protein
MNLDPEIVKNFVTWALVMVGWYIISRDNAKRDRRGEIRDMLGEAQQLALDLEKLGRQYWTCDESDPKAKTLAFEIKLTLSRLARHVNHMFQNNRHMDALLVLKQYRQALTDDAFEQKARAPLALSDAKLMNIASLAVQLSESLEDGFQSVYC